MSDRITNVEFKFPVYDNWDEVEVYVNGVKQKKHLDYVHHVNQVGTNPSGSRKFKADVTYHEGAYTIGLPGECIDGSPVFVVADDKLLDMRQKEFTRVKPKAKEPEPKQEEENTLTVDVTYKDGVYSVYLPGTFLHGSHLVLLD